VWDAELSTHGEEVARLRGLWFATASPLIRSTIERLAGLKVECTYFRGWSGDMSLADSLASGADRDRQRGSTLAGPHRADVLLRIDGRPARECLSRGQQKLVAASLVLALLSVLRQQGQAPPTLLLDDPAAELDSGHLERLVELVCELDCQLVITSLDPKLRAFGVPDSLFHVEQGSVQRL
jgi:DNA replication and repair protein RecF